jgi:hypothetical protein
MKAMPDASTELSRTQFAIPGGWGGDAACFDTAREAAGTFGGRKSRAHAL